jgi:catechol 2,3-dioxygenase
VTDPPIDARVEIGHVHLKVTDLERALGFWRDALGFEITSEAPGAVFLSAGGYHHHIALNTWQSEGGRPPPPGSTGLFHVAIRYPDRRSLGAAIGRVLEHGYRIGGAADHGVSEAVYLFDPDRNGVELYADRPRAEWPRASDGSIAFVTEPLDVGRLIRDAE